MNGTDTPAEPLTVTLDMRDPRAAVLAFLAALPPSWRTSERWGRLYREAHQPGRGAAVAEER